MEYDKISVQLERLSKESGYGFDTDYVGFQKNIERALLFLLDAMFPTYRKYPELFCRECEDLRADALKKADEYLQQALVKKMGPEQAAVVSEKVIEKIPAIYEITGSTMRGMGVSLLPAVLTIFGTCAFRIIWILTAFQWSPTLEVLCIGYPASWLITDIALLIYYRKRSKLNFGKPVPAVDPE